MSLSYTVRIMRTSRIFRLAVGAVGVAPLLATALAAQVPDPLATGRQYTAWFYAGETARIWERFSPEMKAALASAESLAQFRRQVIDQIGTEDKVLAEKVAPSGQFQVYLRKVKFSGAATPVDVQWTLQLDGGVAGFFIRPAQQEAASSHLHDRTKTPLGLPFEGEWRVAWGGRTLEQNAHAFSVDQRFADDFVKVRDGSTHAGDGTRNEQYYAFGQPILAPAAGKVAAAADGVDDNVPGEMNDRQPLGNYVVLDHGNGEFSFLAHLQKGSVAVKVGDAVKAGQRLGSCGNSGNASEPHLHFHLQTTPRFGDGDGLPAQLRYLQDGKTVDHGEPTKGQTIRPAPAPQAEPQAKPPAEKPRQPPAGR
jgi:murein DD-endopeptidase MepM/ murein hydrolase activator NlpD